MSEVTVQWLEARHFVGVDSTQHGIVISAASESRIGSKPSDLLLMALGSCAATDVVSILEKKRQKLTGLLVSVTGAQQPDPPWAFQSCHMHFTIAGRGLTPKAVEDAIDLAEGKYCSVSATLRLGIPVTHDYEIVEDG